MKRRSESVRHDDDDDNDKMMGWNRDETSTIMARFATCDPCRIELGVRHLGRLVWICWRIRQFGMTKYVVLSCVLSFYCVFVMSLTLFFEVYWVYIWVRYAFPLLFPWIKSKVISKQHIFSNVCFWFAILFTEGTIDQRYPWTYKWLPDYHLDGHTDQAEVWHISYPEQMQGRIKQGSQRLQSWQEYTPIGLHTVQDCSHLLRIHRLPWWEWHPIRPGRGGIQSTLSGLSSYWGKNKRKGVMVRERGNTFVSDGVVWLWWVSDMTWHDAWHP